MLLQISQVRLQISAMLLQIRGIITTGNYELAHILYTLVLP
uniref:Uncharacterized protein n=1 Tax=Arundo donax TaxID=35708 RepID=A0A0A8YPV0_ARUDO